MYNMVVRTSTLLSNQQEYSGNDLLFFVLRDWVGLRPGRCTVRIEREQVWNKQSGKEVQVRELGANYSAYSDCTVPFANYFDPHFY